MAQSGYTPIKLYSSSTASAVPSPSNLAAGELAINTADGKLFYKDSPGGTVQVIASKAGNINVASFSGGTTGLTPNTATTGAVTLAGTLALANGGTNATSAPAAMASLTGFTTTATAAGTTTLTNTSSFYQVFTGSTTQTIVLPVTSTLALGWTFHICNNSTGNLTLNSSGGNLVITIPPGTTAMCTCILITGTTAASWEAGLTDFSTYTGTGNLVLSNSPTLVTPALGIPASGVVTNLTGTASININGTVGATTANSGAFTTLSSTSDATINGLTVGLGAGAASGNTTVGYLALDTNTSGTNNTAIGNTALNSNTGGANNTAIGYAAANYNINGTDNTALGANAFGGTNSGDYNTAVGSSAAYSINSSGSYNCVLGYQALYAFTTSNNNTAIGVQTLQNLITGNNNTVVGCQAANGSSSTGNNNTAVGYQSLYNYSSGGTNTVLGYNSGYDISTGSNNVILGGYTGLAAPISQTGSNWVVLSDGAGNVRQVMNATSVQFLTGAEVVYSPAPATTISAATTLTNAQLLPQIVVTSGTSFTLTMPLGTTLDTLVAWAGNNLGFDFSLINLASAAVSLGTNTGVTNVGILSVTASTSARFRIRRTAASTYIVYRLS